MGELGIGHQRGDLEDHPEGQVGGVDVGEGGELGAMAGQQRKRHVEDEEEDQQRPDAQADLATDEGPPVPPPTVRLLVWLVGGHLPHVDTPGPADLTC